MRERGKEQSKITSKTQGLRTQRAPRHNTSHRCSLIDTPRTRIIRHGGGGGGGRGWGVGVGVGEEGERRGGEGGRGGEGA